MSEPIEPKVRFQTEWMSPHKEWWALGDEQENIERARHDADRALFANFKRRLIKITTTFEVVEEMEPK